MWIWPRATLPLYRRLFAREQFGGTTGHAQAIEDGRCGISSVSDTGPHHLRWFSRSLLDRLVVLTEQEGDFGVAIRGDALE